MTSPSSRDVDSVADLFRGLAHPIRLRILLLVAGRTLSPSELGPLLTVPLGLVSYHVRALRDDGLLELADSRAVRGSVQSFYRLTPRGVWAHELLAGLLPEDNHVEDATMALGSS